MKSLSYIKPLNSIVEQEEKPERQHQPCNDTVKYPVVRIKDSNNYHHNKNAYSPGIKCESALIQDSATV
ncbi:MAG: hypothetical protein ACXWV1_13925 [Chitinophagaceae bacterium]